MQTAFEAIDNLLHHRPADHVPMTDGPWGDTLKKWVTQGMPANDKGEPVDFVEHFGFDMAGCGGGFTWDPRLDAGQTLEETDEWRITINGSGGKLKWWKNKSGTPEHIDFAMSSREVWDRDYRPLLVGEFDRKRLGDLSATARNLAGARAKGKWALYGCQFIWENMRAAMGDFNMYTSLVTDPAWIHDYNRVYTDLYKKAFTTIIGECGKPDGVWLYEDLGYKHRLFCSPAVLEELIFPYYKEMVDFFHAQGLPVILHTCGFTEPALPLIVQTGFDGLHPMEVKAGNDIFRIAEGYGDKLMFVGGLDARILESHDRELIRKGVTDLIQGMRRRGARFVYGSDHSISTNVDYEDFQYSLKVYRDNMIN